MSKEMQGGKSIIHIDKRYKNFLNDIKSMIRSRRLRAAIAVNQELIAMYWHIGKQIIEKQKETAWGSKLIDVLSNDLNNAFPETTGFSSTNLKRMRHFAELYQNIEIGAQTVPQLPWGHIILLIQKVKNSSAREWYAQQAIENGWSRFTLADHIKQELYQRQAVDAVKTTNFLKRLPSPQSRLAQDLIKNPYNFDFLGLHDDAYERDIEHASVQHITKFMIEMGKGFAFVGTQVPVVIDDQEFFIDMLFYNLVLRCFVVVEIKSVKFKPEHAGQLNFYLSAVDTTMRHKDDQPTIGLLLCKSRNKIVAEYSLKDIEKPIGISEYKLTKALPKKLKNTMPTIAEIEAELNVPDNKNQEDKNAKNKN